MTKRRLHFVALAALAGFVLTGCAVYPEDRGYDRGYGGYDRGYDSTYDRSYGLGAGSYGFYDRGPVNVSEYHYWHRHDSYRPHRHDRRGDRWDHRRNGQLYYGRPGEAPEYRQRDGRPDSGYRRDQRRAEGSYRRDWRQGDGEFRRLNRQQTRVGLEERTRRNRQERIEEGLNDRGDDASRRRDQRIGRTPGETTSRHERGTISDFDARQQRRSAPAQRAAQRRAAEVRRQLLAERRAAAQTAGGGQRQRQLQREGASQSEEQRRRQLEREGIDPYQVPGTGAQTNR